MPLIILLLIAYLFFNLENTAKMDNYATKEECGVVANNTILKKSVVNNSGMCFDIIAPNIVFDCDGNNITFGTVEGELSTGGAGVHSAFILRESAYNVTIKNCKLFGGFGKGLETHIYAINQDWNKIKETNYFLNNIINVTTKAWSQGMHIWNGNGIKVINNTIYVIGKRAYGIRFEGDNDNNIVKDNYIEGYADKEGVFITPIELSDNSEKHSTTNNTVENNFINCFGLNENQWALYLAETVDSFVNNNKILTNDCAGIGVNRGGGNSISNNTIVRISGDGVGIIDYIGDNFYAGNKIINFSKWVHQPALKSVYVNTTFINGDENVFISRLELANTTLRA